MSNNASSEPAADEDPHGGHGLGFYALMVLFLLILYVLSIGPAAKYYAKRKSPQFLVRLYAPLEALGRNWKPADSFLSWYVFDVWKARPRPPA